MRLAALSIAFLLICSLNAFAQSERELASVLASNECDYSIEILVDGSEFESQDFKWRMKALKIEGKPTNITGTAQIESDGKTIKSYKPWTSDPISKQKTSNEYSPNLKPGNYEIIAEISVECDDTNKDNNVNRKEITIKGSKETEAEETEEADPKKKASRNEDTSLQEKQISEPKSQQSKSSSKPKSATEDFDNVIELKSQNQKAKEAQITSNTIQNPKNTEIVYESSSEKAKGWIMIFLLTLSILLNIILIWKR